jgi:phage terminase large subunit-like protein
MTRRRKPRPVQSAFAPDRDNPAKFIEQVLIDPETGSPFRLLPAEKSFLEYAFKTGADGRLLYPELVFSAPKKSGKTGFAALFTLTACLLFGGQFAEGYCCANDFEQAQGRVFQAIKRIVERSPELHGIARVLSDKIEFPLSGATISALSSDYAGAAGANPTISTFDELWGYVSEKAHRLFDEMVPPPTRRIACRLTVTYAGFENESTLLEELYKRGLQQPQVGPNLYAGNGILMFWSHEPIAPWQSQEWLDQMRRSLRPNQYLRMIENKFVSTESTFVDPEWIERCIDPTWSPVINNKSLPVYIGVDASVKKDSTAIVAVCFDRSINKVRLVAHRIFQPTSAEPLNFELTVERTIKEFCARFMVRGIYYDPYQMASVAQRLATSGLAMREYTQTTDHLTAMGSNLFELIKGGNLVLYPDDAIKLALNRAVAKETPRGWKITKEKISHKIDVVIAMAMAALAAVEHGQHAPRLVTSEWIGVHTAPRTGFAGAPGFGGTPEDIAWLAAGGRFGGGGRNGSVCW